MVEPVVALSPVGVCSGHLAHYWSLEVIGVQAVWVSHQWVGSARLTGVQSVLLAVPLARSSWTSHRKKSLLQGCR